MFNQEDSSTSEKLIIGTVAVIGVVTMVFGFLHVKKSIYSPFKRDQDVAYKTPEQQHQEALGALKVTDTDGDTLTDYDELYVFLTNPYLEDTDSDGIDDGEEINSNSDPNCPKGKSCLSPRVVTGSQQSDGSICAQGEPCAGQEDDVAQEERMNQAFIEIFGDPRQLSRAQAEVRILSLPSEELRQFFVNMGVPQEAVDNADDTTLKELALDALNEISFAQDTMSESGETSGE